MPYLAHDVPPRSAQVRIPAPEASEGRRERRTMVSHEGMGRITVAQADACRRFEYMGVVRRSDWAYLGCYDALVVWPVPPMEGDGTSAQTMFGLADLDVVSSLNGVYGSRAAIVDIDWIDMRDWWLYLVNLCHICGLCLHRPTAIRRPSGGGP